MWGLFSGCVLACLAIGRMEIAQPAATSQPADVVHRFALVSDPHVSLDPRYAGYVENFAQVIGEVNAAKVDAVLVSGDLLQSFRPEAAARFKSMAAGFQAKMLVVPGNHDVGDKKVTTRPATVTEARVDQFAKTLGEPFFSTEVVPSVRVIGIASSLLETGLPREKAQWDFLERELHQPQAGTTFILTHYPPFARTPAEPDEYFNMSGEARARLLKLCKQGGVTAVLSGHLHRPVTFDWDGIPVIGAPAVSFGLPEGQQQVGWRLIELHADGTVTSELKYLAHPAPAPTTRPASRAATGAATKPAELLTPAP